MERSRWRKSWLLAALLQTSLIIGGGWARFYLNTVSWLAGPLIGDLELTLGNARRAVAAVAAIRDALSDKVPPEDALGLHSDAMFRSATFEDLP